MERFWDFASAIMKFGSLIKKNLVQLLIHEMSHKTGFVWEIGPVSFRFLNFLYRPLFVASEERISHYLLFFFCVCVCVLL